MELHYKNKKTEQEIFDSIPNIELEQINSSTNLNLLIHSNNLVALKQEQVDNRIQQFIDLVQFDIALV